MLNSVTNNCMSFDRIPLDTFLHFLRWQFEKSTILDNRELRDIIRIKQHALAGPSIPNPIPSKKKKKKKILVYTQKAVKTEK